jgi:ribosomal protein S18 acetylase RimI-like enzyme
LIADSPLPELETGWLPSTPIGDTYLRRFLLNWQGMCAATAVSLGGISDAIPGAHLADAQRPAPFANCATLTQPLAAETAEATLSEIAAFYELDDPTRDSEVLLSSAWPTGDLRPFGWSLMGHPPLLLLPSGATPPPSPPELRVEEVTDLQGLLAWERVAIGGFPLENLAGAPAGSLVAASWLSDPRRRMWVGWVEDAPVCASSVWIEHGINDVTLVATMPEARRRGYGEALTWRAALADPSLQAMLFSSDEGRPVYERMGLLPLLRLTLWFWDRAANRR